MEPLSARSGQDPPPRGRSRAPQGLEGGGFGEPGGLTKASQMELLGPQAPKAQNAPGTVVTVQGAEEVLGVHKAPNPNIPLRPPVSVVTAQGPQEVKQGVLQDPQATTTTIPKDLQTHFGFPFCATGSPLP